LRFPTGCYLHAIRLRLEKDNIIVFELDIDYFHFTLLRAHSSTQSHMKCKHHGLTVAK
jgi:hypothetical protein